MNRTQQGACFTLRMAVLLLAPGTSEGLVVFVLVQGLATLLQYGRKGNGDRTSADHGVAAE